MTRSSPKDKLRADEFIAAAAELIALNGYDRTSVRDIACKIGLTSGSMFYHFHSKGDLLEAVIGKGITDGFFLAEAALEAARPGSLARFLALVTAHIEIVHGDLRHVHSVWVREWERLSPNARGRMRPMAWRYRDLFDDILRALSEDGHLQIDPVIARHLLLPALNWTPSWAEVGVNMSAQALAEQISAAIIGQKLVDFRTLLHDEEASLANGKVV